MCFIPLKVQRIIMFIPYVNVLNLFIWLNNSRMLNAPRNGVPRMLRIMFSCAIPFSCIQVFTSLYFPEYSDWVSTACVYLLPLLIGRGLIKYQNQLLSKKQA